MAVNVFECMFPLFAGSKPGEPAMVSGISFSIGGEIFVTAGHCLATAEKYAWIALGYVVDKNVQFVDIADGEYDEDLDVGVLAAKFPAASPSNDDWMHPHDPDAKITKMRTPGPTWLTRPSMPSTSRRARSSASVQDADDGDTTTMQQTLPEAAEQLEAVAAVTMIRSRSSRRSLPTRAFALVALSRFVDWRQLLVIVKPDTLISWHRKGFRLLWRWKSNVPGRPRIPANLRQLIAQMATANRVWGEERIAAELLVKLGIHVSPRTVRKYMPPRTSPRVGTRSQTWSTLMRNHARSVLACDFFVAVTATLRVVYVFVVLEVGTRRIVHWNMTEYPTAEWTAQQVRMTISGVPPHRYVIHDHDSIYSEGVDHTLAAMGLAVLRTPVQAPQANTFCERLAGIIRRECLDFLIALTESHLRDILTRWITHYNRGRPQSRLGQGLPDPPPDGAVASNGHQLPDGHRVVAMPILGGLHHEYRLEATA